MRIDRQFGMVQAEQICTDGVNPVSEPNELRSRQKTISACNQQMNIHRQAVCKRTEEAWHTSVGEKVEIVDKNVAR